MHIITSSKPLNTILYMISYLFVASVILCDTRFVFIFYLPGITKFQLYGGDIVLTAAQWSEVEAASNPNDPHRLQLAVVNSDEGKWPGAVVPYEIDSSLSKYSLLFSSSLRALMLQLC